MSIISSVRKGRFNNNTPSPPYLLILVQERKGCEPPCCKCGALTFNKAQLATAATVSKLVAGTKLTFERTHTFPQTRLCHRDVVAHSGQVSAVLQYWVILCPEGNRAREAANQSVFSPHIIDSTSFISLSLS